MEATTVPVPRARQRALARGAAIPWHVYANLVAATSIVVGVLWDISWHRTIGRDSFWTPAHLAIYLGGVLGGASSGWRVLKTTFSGGEAERASAVHFWGFLGPLGAWVSIWGAGAMLTSAPFDDWWHNAYGLDVEILSPPHVLLAIGIIAIVLGATLTVLAEQNRAVSEREGRAYAAMFAYLMGVGVTVLGILATEHTYRIYLHSSAAYQIAGGVFPILLVAAARAGRMRWPATAAAASYTAINAALVWILPLFPGEPLLGPIRSAVTHMVPPDFPLALIVPALVMDLAMQRGGDRQDWRLAVALGVVFAVTFVVVEWLLASLFLSPYGRNWFFAGHVIDYMTPADSYAGRGEFYPGDVDEAAMRRGLGVSVLLAIASSRLGLWLGNWMRRVRR